MAEHQHNFATVARRRGQRKVRYQCSECPRIGPWVEFATETTDSFDAAKELDGLTVTELRQRASATGTIHGYSKMRKAELIDALVKNGNNT